MNAVFNLSHLIRAGIAIAVISMLAACGQRGPLYLPKGQTSVMTPQPVVPVTDPAATPSTQKKDGADDSTPNNQQK